MQRLAWSGGLRYRQTEQGKLVVEKVNQRYGHIAAKQQNAPRLIYPLGDRDEPRHVQRISQRVQVVNILFQGSASMRRQAGIVWDRTLHTFQRSGAGNRQFMKVGFELAIAVKAQA